MKNIFRFFAVTLTAICSLACSKDATFTEEKTFGTTPLTVTATLSSDDHTRVTYSDDGDGSIKQYWVAEDVIYVINSGDGGDQSTYAFAIDPASISEDKKSASFIAPEGYEGTPVYAMHRHTPLTSFDPTAYPLDRRDYTKVEPLSDLCPLYGTYNPATQNFAFKPLSAILRFDLTLPDEMDITNTAFLFSIQTEDGTDFMTNTLVDITGQKPVYIRRDGVSEMGFATYPNESQAFILHIPTAPTQDVVDKIFNIEVMLVTLNEDLSVTPKWDMICTTTQIGGGVTAGKCHNITKTADDWTMHAFSWIGDGTGTAQDPHIITTEEQLHWLADYTNTNMFSSSLLTDHYFELGNDITITTTETSPWMPIGGTDGFTGFFDGKGHSIKAAGDILYLFPEDIQCIGLFSATYNNISNLTLEANIMVNNIMVNNPDSEIAIGGIVGYFAGKAITNCHHIGGIKVNSSTNPFLAIGGITGIISGGEIHNCTQSGGEILDNNLETFSYIGGIVGGASSGLISGCSNSTHLTTTISDDYESVGGVIGWCMENFEIHNSTNSGDIKITTSNTNIEQPYAGGIMGYYEPDYGELSIYNCSSSTGRMYLNDAEVNPIPNVGSMPDYALTECNTPHTAK